ncbi:MAG: pyridoxal-phosphate dependent enzyme [Acidobacteriota bacterium]|nr:pyridoxal-phosphate dependent enzyme [Acidobacteriota bacterium]
MRFFMNPAVRRDDTFRGLFTDDEYRDVRDYAERHYQTEISSTPLARLDTIARNCGIASILAKDETHRQGINAFKITGVSYAVERIGVGAARRGLVCATAGNHGRAVARVAREKGVACTVFLPVARTLDPIEQRTRSARVDAMRQDGATVIEVAGTYEEAVARAATFGAEEGATVVSDTSWNGYEQIPRWIMAGYTRIFEEASHQWEARPDLVVVQGGVGGLVCAAASWFAARYGAERPFIVAAEPEHAACLLESARIGSPATLTGSLDTIMAGLRCAEPSPLAWPVIAGGVDAFVTVSDASAIDTMLTLTDGIERERIEAGPSGACGLAALRDMALAPGLSPLRSVLHAGRPLIDTHSRALVVITEGSGR